MEAETWEAISYATDLWDEAEEAISLAHQEAHVRSGGRITRVFVFDSDRERQRYLDVMQRQSSSLANTDVRWILKSDLIVRLQNRLDVRAVALDLLDFALANNDSYLLWFHLKDDTTQLDSATITIDPQLLERARTIFNVAYTHGNKLNNHTSTAEAK